MENPHNSLIGMHERFVWLVTLLRSFQINASRIIGTQSFWGNCMFPVYDLNPGCYLLAKMWKVAFWMKKHGAPTWKRTWVWGSSRSIAALDLGPLLPSERKSEVKTTKTWVGKDGKKKWQGSENLKATQFFAIH